MHFYCKLWLSLFIATVCINRQGQKNAWDFNKPPFFCSVKTANSRKNTCLTGISFFLLRIWLVIIFMTLSFPQMLGNDSRCWRCFIARNLGQTCKTIRGENSCLIRGFLIKMVVATKLHQEGLLFFAWTIRNSREWKGMRWHAEDENFGNLFCLKTTEARMT